MAGSWVRSKASKKVSIGFHVSTPSEFFSTTQSSSGRDVIGKRTFLNRTVCTVEEVGIILAMRGIYEVEVGSSLFEERVIFEVVVEDGTVAGNAGWSEEVAMEKIGK